MSGAVSFVLSLLGLGASGAVSVGQSVSRKKADYEFGEAHGYHGTPDVLRMRDRVRKEWWSVCGDVYNACGKPASEYGNPYKTPYCFVNTLISRKLDIKVFTNNKSLTNNFFSCSLFCCLNLAHFLYLFYIERVQFLRQNHIISESISRMFYCDSRFS